MPRTARITRLRHVFHRANRSCPSLGSWAIGSASVRLVIVGGLTTLPRLIDDRDALGQVHFGQPRHTGRAAGAAIVKPTQLAGQGAHLACGFLIGAEGTVACACYFTPADGSTACACYVARSATPPWRAKIRQHTGKQGNCRVANWPLSSPKCAARNSGTHADPHWGRLASGTRTLCHRGAHAGAPAQRVGSLFAVPCMRAKAHQNRAL
jgi:hypothetical protein